MKGGVEDIEERVSSSRTETLRCEIQRFCASWQAVGEPDAPPWKLSGTQGASAFWEKSEAPLPPQKHVGNFMNPKQLSPFPERLKLPCPDEEILSGYEEDVSFIRDGFTTWVKADFNTNFGTTCGRRSKGPRGVSRSICQKTRHICSRVLLRQQRAQPLIRTKTAEHLQPRRGREGAVEEQIAGKWLVITLQEAIEYVYREFLTNRFHVTHYGGCVVLFNKDTSFPDVKVKSIYLHDIRRVVPDKVMEGDSGWVLHASLASQRPKNFHSSVVAHQ